MKPLEDDEVALKLLHTADWHLGLKFPQFEDEDAKKLMRARLDAVRRVFDLARQHTVDTVLCAGDLFDDPQPDDVWCEGLLRCLTDLTDPHRPIVLLPGNHDPVTAASVWDPSHRFRQELPDHVHVVDRDDFSLEIGDEAIVYAAPCRSRAGEQDLAMGLPAREDGDDRIRIGLCHGQTFDMREANSNFPIDPRATVERGLDYLAIGDTHGFREIAERGAPPTVYPGAPEATAFDLVDPGHVALVFFARKGRRALIRRQKVAQWTWREETIRDPTSLRTLCETQELRQTVLRLKLEMSVSVQEMAEVDRLLDELKGTDAATGRAGILQLERDGLTLDTTNIEEAFDELPDVLRVAVTRLKEREGQGASEARLAQRALMHLYRVVQGETARR